MVTRRTSETLFRITLASVIAIESLLTIVQSLRSTTESHLGRVLPWFAGAELVAAVMLLIPHTVNIGGFVLLFIFLIALIIHGPAQQMALFVYAAGVLLVMSTTGKRSRDTSGGE